MKKYCVYVHICPNNKKYVGITSNNPLRRWRSEGKGYKYKNKKFYKAIQKYGWDQITHKILIEGLNKEQACKWESRLIKYWNTYKNGYNCTLGGENNSPTKEISQKISETIKTKYICKGKNNPMYGKKHSVISKKRMSEALKQAKKEGRWKPSNWLKSKSLEEQQVIRTKISLSNKKWYLEHCKPIKCIELNKIFYGGNREAAKQMELLTNKKFSFSRIAKICRSKKGTCNGFTFVYVELEPLEE